MSLRPSHYKRYISRRHHVLLGTILFHSGHAHMVKVVGHRHESQEHADVLVKCTECTDPTDHGWRPSKIFLYVNPADILSDEILTPEGL